MTVVKVVVYGAGCECHTHSGVVADGGLGRECGVSVAGDIIVLVLIGGTGHRELVAILLDKIVYKDRRQSVYALYICNGIFIGYDIKGHRAYIWAQNMLSTCRMLCLQTSLLFAL